MKQYLFEPERKVKLSKCYRNDTSDFKGGKVEGAAAETDSETEAEELFDINFEQIGEIAF
jgi:hypothetical protein